MSINYPKKHMKDDRKEYLNEKLLSGIIPIKNTFNNIKKDKSKTKQDLTESKLRQKEEGFSVYFMGPNEERIKAMRKKEQIEKLKNRSNNNSQTKIIRKKWEPIIKPDTAKSKKNNRLNYQAVSKLILNDNLSNNYIKSDIQTLDDVMDNFENKSSKDNRKRNWDDAKIGIHFSEMFDNNSNNKFKNSEYLNKSKEKNLMLDNLNDSNDLTNSFEKNTYTKYSTKNRPFSSIMNLSRIKALESTKNKNTVIQYEPSPKKVPNIEFIFKSPKINIRNNRPYSQINSIKHNNSMTTKKPAVYTNRDKSNERSTKKSKYPIINTTPISFERKKLEIINKLDQLDERKLNKLAKVVEKLTNIDELCSSEATFSEFKNLKKSKNMESLLMENFKEKFNINYIKTDSINFGNININLNEHNKYNENNNINTIENSTNRFNRSSSMSPKKKTNITIVFKSNWGHMEKIGLTEVQLLDEDGKEIEIIECLISGYKSKTINKLYNKKFNTNDETDMWVCPYIPGMKLEIFFDYNQVGTVIIWNFNGKDLSKGVKDIELYVNGVMTWKGVIEKGSFLINDYSTRIVLNSYNSNNKFVRSLHNAINEYDNIDEDFLKTSLNSTLQKYMKTSNAFITHNANNTNRFEDNAGEPLNIYSLKTDNFIKFSRMKIVLTSNYGNNTFIGLTGLQLLNDIGEEVNIENAVSLGALPKDLNTLNDNCGDPRIFENIFNSLNEVVDDYYMWLTIFEIYSPPYIEIVFQDTVNLSAIKIWNYNKYDELDKGVKTIEIIIDEDYSNSSRIVLRKGIGEENIDFSQIIKFPFRSLNFSEEEMAPFKLYKPASKLFEQDFDTPYLPTGFIYRMNFLSNKGDNTHIGLNGLELYDQIGRNIFNCNSYRTISVPNNQENINDLFTNKGWVSNYNNLKKGRLIEENTFSNFFSLKERNAIYIIFDKPISVSFIQIHNLLDSRGVKEIQIFCDDNIIYNGNLKDDSTIILFTAETSIVKNINDSFLTSLNMKNIYNHINTEKENILLLQN